jgi:hypothetical protein
LKSIRLTTAGSITAALASAGSWFCCLPFAIGALGAGTGTFALALGAYRPLFNGAALLLITIAIGLTYQSTRGCTEAAACRRARASRIMLWLTAAFILAMIAAPLWTSRVIYFFIT